MFKQSEVAYKKVFYSDLLFGLEHFFTTRESDVDNNFEPICNYLGVSAADFIHPDQTHSANVEYAIKGKQEYKNTDAIILTNYEQAVYLRFADCTPIIFYDKRNNIGAVVHAGWRGTASKIAPKTVQVMIKNNNTSLNSLYVAIGPAIGACCYTVGDDVIEKISNTISTTDNLILNNNKIDLKGINAQQLIDLGVPKENIDICPYCTSCNNDMFYSYRKENGTTERHNAVIKLKRL